jgi:phenylacetic acid degradation operon negative regulatory protein
MTRNRNGVEALLDRPLTARSVIASLLLGRHPPTAPVSLLVRWCALFDISETSSRVALSRMVERGELSAAEGTYALAGRMRDRQADQDFAFAPTLRDWDGTWVMAIVPDGRRDAPDRVALREALRRSRMVPWRSGVWVRPDNLGDRHASAGDREVIESQCSWWRGAPLDAVEVGAAYALDELDARGRLLVDRLGAQTARLPDVDALADAFVVGAAAAQHLRRDPLLPASLLPDGWHGERLRELYRGYVDAMGVAVVSWVAAST